MSYFGAFCIAARVLFAIILFRAVQQRIPAKLEHRLRLMPNSDCEKARTLLGSNLRGITNEKHLFISLVAKECIISVTGVDVAAFVSSD